MTYISPPPSRTTSRSLRVLVPVAIVAVWATTIYAIAASDGFAQPAGQPPSRLALAFFAPVLLFAAAYRLVPSVRSWVAAQDLALLVGAQAWRVLGMVFLFLLGLGQLPATFAIPAGVGDVAVGVFAVFVLIAVLRQTQGWTGQVRWLVGLGMLDFLVAIGTGTLSGEGRLLQIEGAPLPLLMQSLPMVLIPTFGVPFFMILHLMAWLKLPAVDPATGPARKTAAG